MVLTGRITFFAKPIGRLYRPFAQCRETYTKASMKSLHQKEMQMSRVALSFFASQSSLLSTVLHRAFPWEPELYRAVSLDFLAFGPSGFCSGKHQQEITRKKYLLTGWSPVNHGLKVTAPARHCSASTTAVTFGFWRPLLPQNPFGPLRANSTHSCQPWVASPSLVNFL